MPLFTYGTLRAPAMMAAVAGPGPLTAGDAQLSGWRVAPVAGAVVPMLLPAPDGAATGTLWHGLTDAQLARLDAWELAFGYTRVTLPVAGADGIVQALVYLPPAGQVPGPGDWSLDAWAAAHLAPACDAAAEVFAGGVPEAPDWAANWPMIMGRAWAKQRARARDLPARVRHAPLPDHLNVSPQGPALGDFFRLQRFDVTARRFDDAPAPALRREVFVGTDAALVLPYDAARDRLLLVEQPRMGPAWLGDPNPWTLEPIAGMVDAGETPEDCARREAAEEAGLTLGALEPIAAFYPSPGSSTDYFYCFLAPCDLPHATPFAGGLADEHENLRVHPLSFAQAEALMVSGEITAGPLILMLLWLARYRAERRGGS